MAEEQKARPEGAASCARGRRRYCKQYCLRGTSVLEGPCHIISCVPRGTSLTADSTAHS